MNTRCTVIMFKCTPCSFKTRYHGLLHIDKYFSSIVFDNSFLKKKWKYIDIFRKTYSKKEKVVLMTTCRLKDNYTRNEGIKSASTV